MKKILIQLFFALAMVLSAGESYDFLMISDTHFGSADSYYDGDDPRYRTKKDIHRADKAMPYTKAMFAHMAKESTPATKFLIHAGDIIEGKTKGYEAHKAVLNDAFALMHEYFKMPVYFVRGNHEAPGLGGKKAWRDAGLTELSKTVGKTLDKTSYTVNCGGDLYIFVDYSDRRYPEFVRNVLQNISIKPRYIFVIIHPEVLPFATNVAKQLCEVIAPYNVIALHGHTHRVQNNRYERNGGSVTTFSVASYLTDDLKKMYCRGTKNDLAAWVADYRKRRAKTPVAKEILDKDCVPYLTSFAEYSSGAKFHGYARIFVSDAGVVAHVQSADLTQKPVTIKIK